MKSKEEEYEKRVKARVLKLKEFLEKSDKKINIVGKEDAVNFEESFRKIRYDSDGNPILETVDGRIRSLALVIEQVDHRDKMKSAISLQQIQEGYFNRIEGNFNHFYKMMIDNDVSPSQVANVIAYGKQPIDNLDEVIKPILKDLEEFWELVAESGYLHLEEDYDSIKAVFG